MWAGVYRSTAVEGVKNLQFCHFWMRNLPDSALRALESPRPRRAARRVCSGPDLSLIPGSQNRATGGMPDTGTAGCSGGALRQVFHATSSRRRGYSVRLTHREKHSVRCPNREKHSMRCGHGMRGTACDVRAPREALRAMQCRVKHSVRYGKPQKRRERHSVRCFRNARNALRGIREGAAAPSLADPPRGTFRAMQPWRQRHSVRCPWRQRHSVRCPWREKHSVR